MENKNEEFTCINRSKLKPIQNQFFLTKINETGNKNLIVPRFSISFHFQPRALTIESQRTMCRTSFFTNKCVSFFSRPPPPNHSLLARGNIEIIQHRSKTILVCNPMSVFHTITRIVVKHCSHFRFQSDRIQLPRVCYRLTVSCAVVSFFFFFLPVHNGGQPLYSTYSSAKQRVYYNDLQNRGNQISYVVVRDVIFCRPCLSGVSRTERVSFVRIYIFAVPYSDDRYACAQNIIFNCNY